MPRIQLNHGDGFLISRALARVMSDAEEGAADEFWYAHLGQNPKMRIEAREYMNLHLAEMKQCHEIRARLPH